LAARAIAVELSVAVAIRRGEVFMPTIHCARDIVASGFCASVFRVSVCPVSSGDDPVASDGSSQQRKHRVRLADGRQRVGARAAAKGASAKRSGSRSIGCVQPNTNVARRVGAVSWLHNASSGSREKQEVACICGTV
jgi:hypothetical protein